MNWSPQLSFEKPADFIVKIADFSFFLKSELAEEFSNFQRIISIKPAFSFTNLLPFAIDLEVFSTRNREIFRINTKENLPFYEEKVFELRIKGKTFDFSEKIPLENGVFQRKKVKLCDFSAKSEVFLYINMENTIEMPNSFCFFSDFLIWNQSPFLLWICGKSAEFEIIERQRIGIEEKLASCSEIVEINDNAENVALNGFAAQSVEVFVERDGVQMKLDLLIETKPLKFGFFEFFAFFAVFQFFEVF